MYSCVRGVSEPTSPASSLGGTAVGAERALFCEFGEATRANKWFQMQCVDIYILRVHIDIQSLQVIYVYKVVARIYTLMFIATEKGYSSGLMIHFWMNR